MLMPRLHALTGRWVWWIRDEGDNQIQGDTQREVDRACPDRGNGYTVGPVKPETALWRAVGALGPGWSGRGGHRRVTQNRIG